MPALIDFTTAYTGGPAFYTGTGTTSLVPDVFPVALNGRPYMVDLRSNRFARQFDMRVREQSDQSTAPGEQSISPQGFWRRGEASWHFGAGQPKADVAGAMDYRFWRSKGVNPWTKGQVSLLNDTKLVFPSTATNLQMLEVNGHVYVADGNNLRWSTSPFTDPITRTVTTASGNGTTMTYTTSVAHGFTAGQIVTVTGMTPAGYNVTKATIAGTPSTTQFTVAGAESGVYSAGGTAVSYPWRNVTGEPGAAIKALASDGNQVYVAYTNEGILMTSVGGSSVTDHYATSGGTYDYTALGFAKGFMVGVHNDTSNTHVHAVPYAASTSHGSAVATLRSPAFSPTGVCGGQSHIYIAGRANDVGLVYRLGIKDDGTIDVAVVALEFPVGEYPTGMFSYLGAILVGTNKGVRYCTTDSQGNLLAGSLIPTTGGSVTGFTGEDRFVWFTWTNYDGTSGGLGRLDLSTFTATNTPAFATDLMYSSTAAVRDTVTLSAGRLFSVSAVGVVAEDTSSLVASGTLETGSYQWGIPDRKFVPRFDVRSTPLVGTITVAASSDSADYVTLSAHATQATTEQTMQAPETKLIEQRYRLTLARQTATTGPTLTRWMARAYAAPARSQLITLPLLIHERIQVHGKDYFFDVEAELDHLRGLVADPGIVSYQEKGDVFSVIVEDVEWQVHDSTDRAWLWNGTATVIMRTVTE